MIISIKGFIISIEGFFSVHDFTFPCHNPPPPILLQGGGASRLPRPSLLIQCHIDQTVPRTGPPPPTALCLLLTPLYLPSPLLHTLPHLPHTLPSLFTPLYYTLYPIYHILYPLYLPPFITHSTPSTTYSTLFIYPPLLHTLPHLPHTLPHLPHTLPLFSRRTLSKLHFSSFQISLHNFLINLSFSCILSSFAFKCLIFTLFFLSFFLSLLIRHPTLFFSFHPIFLPFLSASFFHPPPFLSPFFYPLFSLPIPLPSADASSLSPISPFPINYGGYFLLLKISRAKPL